MWLEASNPETRQHLFRLSHFLDLGIPTDDLAKTANKSLFAVWFGYRTDENQRSELIQLDQRTTMASETSHAPEEVGDAGARSESKRRLRRSGRIRWTTGLIIR